MKARTVKPVCDLIALLMRIAFVSATDDGLWAPPAVKNLIPKAVILKEVYPKIASVLDPHGHAFMYGSVLACSQETT